MPLSRIATFGDFLDIGGVPIPEAAGNEAMLAGARTSASDDDTLLADARRLFRNLFINHQQESFNDWHRDGDCCRHEATAIPDS